MDESQNLPQPQDVELALMDSSASGGLYLWGLFPLQLLQASPTQMDKLFSTGPLVTHHNKNRHLSEQWLNKQNEKDKNKRDMHVILSIEASFSFDSLDVQLLWEESCLTATACLWFCDDDDRFLVLNFLWSAKQ